MALDNLPIRPESISFEAIRQDLIDYAQDSEEGAPWRDWLTTQDGVIVLEWIAALGALERYAQAMRLREGSLNHARTTASVHELAALKGYLVPPASAPELTVELTVETDVTLNAGERVADIGEHSLYLMGDSISVAAGTPATLSLAMGLLRERTVSLGVDLVFRTLTFEFLGEIPARQLEELTVDGTRVPLTSDVSDNYDSPHALRRVRDSVVTVYTGIRSPHPTDSAKTVDLGWSVRAARSATYRALTFNENADAQLTLDPTPANARWSLEVTSRTRSVPAPDRETVRAQARYYPLMGNIVHDRHYEAVALQRFASRVHDVQAVNEDPRERLIVLAGEAVDAAAAETLAGEIAAVIDRRRVANVEVRYEVVNPSDGRTVHRSWRPTDAETSGDVADGSVHPRRKSFAIEIRVPEAERAADLDSRIAAYLAPRRYRFHRGASSSVTAVEVATQLAVEFNVHAQPVDPSHSVELEPGDFFAEFSATIAGAP